MQNLQKLEDMKEAIGGWGEVAKPRLDRILKYAGNMILDVGCGSGGYITELLKNGYVIYGVDILALCSLKYRMQEVMCYLKFIRGR